jgi:ribonuclease HI
MAKKNKHYAARSPQDGAVFVTWEACQAWMSQHKGSKGKSFSSFDEAQAFADGRTPPESLDAAIPNGWTVYVDGSFSPKSPYAGWGWVLLIDREWKYERSGKTPIPALSRNIDGELYATVDAIRTLASKCETLNICHDYEGIEAWATGRWKAKSEIALRYIEVLQDLKSQVKLRFHKIDAHTGDRWNEKADELAKRGLQTDS